MCGIGNYEQIVPELDVLAEAETFGEDFNDLLFARNETDVDVIPMNTLSNKMKVNFNVVGMSMVYWISYYVCDSETIIKDLNRNVRSDVQSCDKEQNQQTSTATAARA